MLSKTKATHCAATGLENLRAMAPYVASPVCRYRYFSKMFTIMLMWNDKTWIKSQTLVAY